jgi:ankyrin repeat protein
MSGKSPLMYAAEKGYQETAVMLINKGADINIKNKAGDISALILALNNGHTDIAKLLINKGADINIINYYGEHLSLQHQKTATRKSWNFSG